MDAADDVAVFFGGLTEWAVVQQDLTPPAATSTTVVAVVVDRFGGEADAVQGADETLDSYVGSGAAERLGAIGEVAAPRLSRVEG